MFSRVEAPGKRVETVSGNEKQMRTFSIREEIRSSTNQSFFSTEDILIFLLHGTRGLIVFISNPLDRQIRF